ncbi:hypothetical protein CC1G_09578 [Coprinopsis cinerea okayama7|uniref:Uncharacterized protein n=1 Tax=Coprinopsis cinerea (strain Okayama-7 / 130 / ATCC MYA-4618 / FGSC 9003) TaxID=240176 RepID=A8P988_COPC7|nr:hypothetical protein CC1G_09578 [Coprinopsis cinerea okayama7\|eukprot:XP_001839723.1 hypothetical protein CC1G_09578 [Coprinopsis cinerea okayama7\
MAPPQLPKFSSTQRQFILNLLPEFREWLDANNPTVIPRHSATTAWIKTTASDIMRHKDFAPEHLQGHEPSEMEGDIRTFFRNWKNASYRPRNAEAQPISSSPRRRLNVDRALEEAIQAVLILKHDLSTRDFFLLSDPDAYQKEYNAQKAAHPKGTPTCTISMRARKAAWANADQSYWEKKKNEMAMDVVSNQALWPKFFRESIQHNVSRGIVGTVGFAIVYGFRTENDGIQHGILYGGHDSLKKEEINHRFENHDEILKAASRHFDKVLPTHSTPSVYDFERDSNGCLILPTLDLSQALPGQVANLLTSFLKTIWHETYPTDNDMPSIPWTQLGSSPSIFYDTSRFSLPPGVVIGGVTAPCPLPFVLSLYDYLRGLQDCGTPFAFRTKDEIQARLKAVADEVEKDVEKDDEALGDAAGAQETRPTPTGEKESSGRPPAVTVLSSPVDNLISQPEDALSATPISSTNDANIANASNAAPGDAKLPVDPSVETHVLVQGSTSDKNLANDTRPSKKSKATSKLSKADREVMAPITNVESSSTSRSTRVRTQAVHGPQLIAGGQRSPVRNPSWMIPGGSPVPFGKKRSAPSEATRSNSSKRRRK